MNQLLQHKWIFYSILTFLGLNFILIANDFHWFTLIPFALIVIFFALFSADKIFYTIAFFAPISFNIEELDIDFGLYIPTEPLLFGLTVLFFLRAISGFKLDKKLLTNGITIVVISHLAWIFITALTSSMPLVSIKFFISRFWFVIPLFFMAYFFLNDLSKMKKLLWLYITPLCFVVVYTFVRLWQQGFMDKASHWVMQPFFKDHTSYGAILAMVFPFAFYEFLRPNQTADKKFFKGLVFVILTIGVISSYTRAAWVSLVAALGIAILIWLKINWKLLLIGVIAVLGVLFHYQNDIQIMLNKNNQDSSQDLAEHVQSISNVATDASNLERLNRWNCAIKMFQEKPIFGFGPGTYMFQYGAFQHSADLTIISTNFGTLGNAHSEYLGPLAEQGLLGMVFVILLVIVFSVVAISTYYKLENKEEQNFLLVIFLGICTYFIHGVLNNYLDTDKASVLVWSFLAMIVVLNVNRGEKFKL